MTSDIHPPTETHTTAGAAMTTDTHAAAGPLDDLRALPATALRFLVEAVRWMLIGPVQRERIRLDGRTTGTVAIAVSAIVLSAAMLAIVIAAPQIRASSELAVNVSAGNTLSVPRAIVWLFVFAIIVFIALLHTGAMHTTTWFRLATLAAVALMLVFIGSIDTTGGMSLGVWVAVGGSTILIVFEVMRWRTDPAWWESLVVLAVATAVVVVVYARSGDVAALFGLDRAPLLTDSIIGSFRLISLPLAVFAGVAVVKVALSGMTLVSDFAAERFSAPTFGAITAAVVVWRLIGTITGWAGDWRTDTAGAAEVLVETLASVAALVGVWLLVHHLLDCADRRARRATDDDAPVTEAATTVKGIIERLDDVAVPAAVVIAILAVPTFIALLAQQSAFALAGGEHWISRAAADLASFVGETSTIRWTRIVGGLGLIGAGLWLAHRGRRRIAELTAVVGAILVIIYASPAATLSGESALRASELDRVGVVVATTVAVWWAARRTLSIDRLGVVLLLVLISSLFSSRDFVSSPITALIGTSGIALVLFGFVWTFLADAGKTSITSPGFPRDSRLLLFCAQALFGLTVLAWVALTRNPASGLELSAASGLGDATLGIALLTTVYLTVLGGALRRAEFVDSQPAMRDDAAGEPHLTSRGDTM